MKIQKFNISKPEKYQGRDGEKTMWHNIGTMTVFVKDDGSISRIMEIPAIGLKANIFPFQDKNQEQAPRRKAPERTEAPGEEVNPDDIPF